uniref:Uncharacterized protein n=1 Tax=Anguilla anguilla TaxID=7936 RepID=A0A0E9T355_ANGAN
MSIPEKCKEMKPKRKSQKS